MFVKVLRICFPVVFSCGADIHGDTINDLYGYKYFCHIAVKFSFSTE